ncbi:MAG TPA: hypothetical protein VD926_09190 [Acidimicrobiales bacterium]|nr:hypothetical protein [Acidimicrobiales bacterium]
MARWSTSGAIPVEFVMCLSPDELRVRLRSGRLHSALLLDGGLPDADRSLLALAESAACPVIVIAPDGLQTDWRAIGASGVLPAEVSRERLLRALHEHAVALARTDQRIPDAAADVPAASPSGRLVAVTGPGGTGASVCAMGLAAAVVGRDAGERVLLADLALRAEQAMLHDVGDVVPGLPEVIDAHRRATPSGHELRSSTFAIEAHGYDLLLGLRRPQDWTAVQPAVLDRAIRGLRTAYRVVVADIDPDVEGERECGSLDVEERNAAARLATAAADLVFAVGGPGPKGIFSLGRLLAALVAHGVESDRVVPVINRAPRRRLARREVARAVAATGWAGTRLATEPVFLPERRALDDSLRHGLGVPADVGRPLAEALDRLAPTAAAVSPRPDPTPIVAGTLTVLAGRR